MGGDRYAFATAVADLVAAGRPVTAHQAGPRGWSTPPVAQLTGGFLGAVLDSRQAAADRLFVALAGTQVHGREFVAAALAAGAHALSDRPPGAAAAPGRVVLETDDPLGALGALAAAWRARSDARVAAITGSNGKTTTKDLLAAALGGAGPVAATRGNLNSEQGVPVTLLGITSDHRLAVVEMGASDVGHIAARARLARPQVGVITNAAPAHLEEFGSLERIVEGKGELVEALPADGTAVLNADSPGFANWCERAPCRVVSWGRHAGDHRWSWEPGDVSAPGWLTLDGERWAVPLPGRHNAANLVAAILAARALGVADTVARRGLAAFRPSPHRAHLRSLGGRLVLDDAYNANPESMVAAVRMLCDLRGGPALAVLGHMAELGTGSSALHRECGREIAALPLARLVAVGEGAAPLADGHEAAGGQTTRCADAAEAAALLAAHAPPGARILVKGSRSAGMERVVAHLLDEHGWTEETP
jgi:UDP-N-acetylmuramoyl-tripeptide--D-alanyl-D-alanine ligase